MKLFGWLLVASACSVPETQTSAEASGRQGRTNECSQDSDCRSEWQASASCGPGICVAESGVIESAIVEIIPPASAFFGAGDSFLLEAKDLAFGDWQRKIVLPQYAKVRGRVRIDPALLGKQPSKACAEIFDPATDTLAVHVEVERWEKHLGLGGARFATDARKAADGWRFSLDLPPGKYDVRVSPLGDCKEFPPLLSEGQSFAPGKVSFEQKVDALASLEGTVKVIDTGKQETGRAVSLAGWRVRVVDSVFGRPISTVGVLNDEHPAKFSLRYQPLDSKAPALLVMVPPTDSVAPKILWDLSVLDINGDGRVGLDLRGMNLQTVHVKGQVLTPDGSPAAEVKVSFHGTKLAGMPRGLRAWYDTTVISSAKGEIELDLLPATYRIVASPSVDMGAAITTATWEIAPNRPLQTGKSISLSLPHTLRGTLRTPTGEPMPYVKVTTSPYLPARRDFAQAQLHPGARPPRPASDTTLLDGSFALSSDDGRVVLTARPGQKTNFPWLVRVGIETTKAGLGDLLVPFPVPLAGTVRDPNGNPVQQATIRVFVMLDSRSNDRPVTEIQHADSTVLVSETQSGSDGKFQAFLPATLQQ